MAARPTKVMESIASFTRSAPRVAVAAFRTRARETLSRRTLDDMSIARPRGGRFTQSPRAESSGAGILGVGFDDLANEPVPHDIGIGEILESDAIDPGKDPLDLDESGFFPLGKIDLSLVTGDHRLRVNSQARQEHLHLRRGCVLRLVENYKGVGECASPHVRERRNLGGARLDGLLHSLVRHR